MTKLAINGGPKVRTHLFPAQLTTQGEEALAAFRVIEKGKLSCYRGNYGPNFYGGPEVKALEKEWSSYCEIGPSLSPLSIAVNSCTSALQIICGAIGIQPGDEVIVTPWSMTCSATSPMIWGGVPIFADIEEDYFCLDPKSVEKRITDKTRAIIVVDLFGQPFDVEGINKIADKHNIVVIEDAAQAPGALYIRDYRTYKSGTLGDVGCFSFTQGKHLTCGEGGIITTYLQYLAERCFFIRNHAEAVVDSLYQIHPNKYQNDKKKYSFDSNMLGYNMRMTEVGAAILREQLKRLDDYIISRQLNVTILNNQMAEIPPIEVCNVRPNYGHTYYVQPFKWKSELAEGIHRDTYLKAVKAELSPEQGRETEGIPIGHGYIQPLYRMPLFQEKTHWSLKGYDYKKYINECPVVEKLWKDELFLWRYSSLPLTGKDRKDLVEAFVKVWENRQELIQVK